ncbi:hypothetical protein B0H17DRAFT_1100573 [Mycena rosella]|uniref:Uncharacterized protein n=1 Tax=Mycena rosella TaxID=1033263 RepID=A0AAD7CNB5_MYCRO|nr:hypothetical protein B0H17DRAFT_1100573 [Mycena rosella]
MHTPDVEAAPAPSTPCSMHAPGIEAVPSTPCRDYSPVGSCRTRSPVGPCLWLTIIPDSDDEATLRRPQKRKFLGVINISDSEEEDATCPPKRM